MALTANPQHRIIRPPAARLEERGPVPGGVRVLQVACWGAMALLIGFLLIGGTIDSRVYYLLAFLISFLNPVWGFYGLALLGPLHLLDPGKIHLLAGVEVFVMGIIAAELRLYGCRIVGINASGQPDARYTVGPDGDRVHWGVWPHFLVGLVLVLAGSALASAQLSLLQEEVFPMTGRPRLDKVLQAVNDMFFGAATSEEWGLKSLWNWATGACVAMIAARRANPLVVARWLKLGGVGLVIACFFSLLDWLGWVPLTHVRWPNPDPLHAGRLQGTAGHAGWYAEWIVLMWPGLLLWWSRGRGRRNMALAAALAMVGLCLVLTAGRAAWIGVAASVGVGCLYLLSAYPRVRRHLVIAAVVAVVILALGILLGGEVQQARLLKILQASDRTNYYVTGLLFLREHPMGIGLGMHYRVYLDWITPYYHWAQSDYVTAHSIWLNALIENGPVVPLLMACGLAGVALELRRAWGTFEEHPRTILVAQCLGVLGILVVGIAQYVQYVRVIEVMTWVGLGAIVGLCRKHTARVGEPVESPRGRRLLLACGVIAIFLASIHAGRSYAGRLPRYLDGNLADGHALWTGSEWRTAVSGDIESIRFSLFRLYLPVDGEVVWPDGRVERFHLEPGETRSFAFDRPEREAMWHEPAGFLVIRVNTVFTPAKHDENSTDARMLGVYLSGLRMDSPRIRGMLSGG